MFSSTTLKDAAVPFIDGDILTWERVNSHQCLPDKQYKLTENSSESAYFSDVVSDILLHLQQQLSVETAASIPQQSKKQVMTALSTMSIDEFEIDWIEYAQLERLKPVDLKKVLEVNTELPDPKVDFFIAVPNSPFVNTQLFVAPSLAGSSYADKLWRPKKLNTTTWTFKLVVHVPLDLNLLANGDTVTAHAVPRYAICMSRSQANTLKLEFGEIMSGEFISWDIAFTINDSQRIKQLCNQSSWHLDTTPHTSYAASMESERPTGPETKKAGFTFSTVDYCLCMLHVKGKDNEEWISKANFCIRKVLNAYVFPSKMEYGSQYILLARQQIADNGSGLVLYKRIEDRHPDNFTLFRQGYEFFDIEVALSLDTLAVNSGLAKVFTDVSPRFLTTLTTKEFLAYLQDMEIPTVKQALSHFGWQGMGIYVAGNCSFTNTGDMMQRSEESHSISTKYFLNDESVPIAPSNYPRHMIVALPWVRYAFAVKLWNEYMPAIFLNNDMAAKCALAFGVMGLQAHRFWAGESGCGRGMPLLWCYSAGPGTGKSEALYLMNSICGLFKREMWSGV